MQEIVNSRTHTSRNMGFFDYNHEQQREEKAMYYQKVFFKCQVKKNESITKYTHNLDNLGKDGESWSFKIIDDLMLSKMEEWATNTSFATFLEAQDSVRESEETLQNFQARLLKKNLVMTNEAIETKGTSTHTTLFAGRRGQHDVNTHYSRRKNVVTNATLPILS